MAAPRMRLTNAGLAAVANAANTGTQAVALTRLQAGSGKAASATGRVALVAPRDAAAIAGSKGALASGIAVTAEIRATAAYAVTEVGAWARAGADGDEFLFAYWSGDAIAQVIAGNSLTLGVAIRIAEAAAEVNVVVSPSITLGSGVRTFLELGDTPDSYANLAGKVLAVNQAGTGIEGVEPTNLTLWLDANIVATATERREVTDPRVAKKGIYHTGTALGAVASITLAAGQRVRVRPVAPPYPDWRQPIGYGTADAVAGIDLMRGDAVLATHARRGVWTRGEILDNPGVGTWAYRVRLRVGRAPKLHIRTTLGARWGVDGWRDSPVAKGTRVTLHGGFLLVRERL